MVVLAPWHIAALVGESVGGVGFGLTVMVVVPALLTQPVALNVQVAVYEVVVVGETAMLVVVAPVFQFIVPAQLEDEMVVLAP